MENYLGDNTEILNTNLQRQRLKAFPGLYADRSHSMYIGNSGMRRFHHETNPFKIPSNAGLLRQPSMADSLIAGYAPADLSRWEYMAPFGYEERKIGGNAAELSSEKTGIGTDRKKKTQRPKKQNGEQKLNRIIELCLKMKLQKDSK
ncbi:hypothetical protein MHBO_001429 [Bonamia ostreae]|uniref:Uncharacterized protein n=1 Tax=Bonamia ostreae TaxID=126728 RepID=A0ABV2AJ05_9EUKA